MAHIDGDDVRALLREPQGVAASLAAGGTGDEGDLALDAPHARTPSCLFSCLSAAENLLFQARIVL